MIPLVKYHLISEETHSMRRLELYRRKLFFRYTRLFNYHFWVVVFRGGTGNLVWVMGFEYSFKMEYSI